MHNSFRSITDVISKEKHFEKIRIKAQEYDILEKFNAIFPQLRKVAEPVKIENSTLFLKVENSVWRSELNFKQKNLIDKINDYFKTEVVMKIKFVSK